MMLEVLRQDYIRTAWAKGLKERVVIFRHVIKERAHSGGDAGRNADTDHRRRLGHHGADVRHTGPRAADDRRTQRSRTTAIVLLLCLVAIFADLLAPFHFMDMTMIDRLKGPSSTYPLGTRPHRPRPVQPPAVRGAGCRSGWGSPAPL